MVEWIKTRLDECSCNKQKQHFKKGDNGLITFGEGSCREGYQDHWLDWVTDDEGGQSKNVASAGTQVLCHESAIAFLKRSTLADGGQDKVQRCYLEASQVGILL